jgi:hypothetical protein
VFETREELQAAWTRGRDRVMALFGTAGRRPMGWWEFDRPKLRYCFERERSILYRAGVLGADEKAKLEAEWRRDFERAQDPNFSHCLGQGRFLRGEEARKAHYRWADIPRELLRQWKAERRRRTRTIRNLETASPPVSA